MEGNRKSDEDKQEFFQVEKIWTHKIVRGQKFYFINWVGYSSKDNTWEPIEHLSNVVYMVEEYEQKLKERAQFRNK